MKKVLYLLLVCLTFCTPSSQIISTHDFCKIEEVMKKADQDTLVVFDVDNVLCMKKDEACIIKEEKIFECCLWLELERRHPKEEFWNFMGIVDKTVQRVLVYRDMPLLIDDLQNKGIKCIALTNWSTWKIGVYDFQLIRIDHLKSVGIHLLDFLNEKVVLTKLEGTILHKKMHPVFNKGILFALKLDKGVVLEEFLKVTRMKFKRIIFIDDHFHKVKEVQRASKRMGVEYMGIVSTFTDEMMPKLSFNKARYEMLFDVLEKEKKWLSFQEVDERLRRKKAK